MRLYPLRSYLAFVCASSSLLSFGASSRAAYVLTLQPDGLGDIVSIGSGSVNTTALTNQGLAGVSAVVWPGFSLGSEVITGSNSWGRRQMAAA